MPDGSIPIMPATGIVFVLLPGGEVPIGAQRDDAAGPNYDPQAVPAMGPVHVHALAPFFLARHEMTQGQWARLSTGDPALRRPSTYGLGFNPVGAVALKTGLVTDQNPVESVDWPMCAQLLARHALAFPTEAQWEYACRAGSTQPWSCARADLVRHANLADATARAFQAEWAGFEPWNDGCLLHVAVGHFLANAFGMHDMHGNVYEWCADGRSGTHGPGGERELGTAGHGICGGAFDSTADEARSAFRRQPPTMTRCPNLGLRAARPLR
jgi:formylglycine-generating enzyme required for sulfatase activity